jgi:hypothetical protein
MTPSLNASTRVVVMSRSRWFLAAAVITAAGAGLLIMQWAGGRMLWLDEEMIALNLRDRSFRELAGPLQLAQAAPYGWLVLQRLVLLAFGPGERVLRFVPMAFGLGTLGVALWIGRRWMTPLGAAALAFLCAVGQWLPFHALELKHYSADACLALLLPALGFWALERTGDEHVSRRRIAIWWMVAAASQWLANGALFAAPACAIVIVATAAYRGGWKFAAVAALPGLVWLASFAANYVVTLAPASASTFLRDYWTQAFPQASAGIVERVRWAVAQLALLAIKPGGSGWPMVFWGAAALGFAAAPGYPLAFRFMFALLPLSALAFGAGGLVPLMDRLALWIIPAVYVGIAMAVELAGSLLTRGWTLRMWPRLAFGAALAVVLGMFGADIVERGLIYTNFGAPTGNHELDDRSAIRWLSRQQQGQDVWVTTRNALPAVWWYAESPASTPIVEASLRDPGACGAEEISQWLRDRGRRRVLLYLGFGHNIPGEFDDAILERLGKLGSVSGYRRYESLGHAIVIDLGQPATSRITLAALSGRGVSSETPINGCIALEPAVRW